MQELDCTEQVHAVVALQRVVAVDVVAVDVDVEGRKANI